MSEPYEILVQVKASDGEQRQTLGIRGCCRYCGCVDPKKFKMKAHTFPEALGNKWVVSLDECDECNSKFSVYEDALTKAVGPFLTLGGIKGKKGVRQTGRTQGDSYIRHGYEDGKRQLSVRSQGGRAGGIGRDPASGLVRVTIPVTGDKFVPLLAYRALCKMGLALMPDEELKNFKKLTRWIGDTGDGREITPLEVGASFASVGNAPPVVAGTLLRRRDPSDAVPYMMFIFCAGSICLQIRLRPDGIDDDLPATGRLGIRWSINLAKPEGGWLKIDYGEAVQLDWSESAMILQPVEAFFLDFDPQTTHGSLMPIMRKQE